MSETPQVHIEREWMRDGIKMLWYRSSFGQQTVVWNPSSGVRAVVSDDTATDQTIEPLVLTDEDARALLTALLHYYDGGEDTRTLRKDYDAERARVDRLIDTITRIASP